MDGSRGEAILPIVAARWRKTTVTIGDCYCIAIVAIVAIVSVIFPSAIMIGRASFMAEVLKGHRVESFQVCHSAVGGY